MLRPVFYRVDPSGIRNQRGSSFGEALEKLESRFKEMEGGSYRGSKFVRVASLDPCFISASLREMEARFEQREVERERERQRSESFRMECEQEWEWKWEEWVKKKEEKEKVREQLKKQRIQEWEAFEKDSEEREREEEEKKR
ncbi:hypothetical protein ABKV19_016888 [Rosa sericea]